MDWPLSLLVEIAQGWECWFILIVVILSVVGIYHMDKQRAKMLEKQVKNYEDQLRQIGLAGGSDKTAGRGKPKWKYSGSFRGRLLSMVIVQILFDDPGWGDNPGHSALHQFIVTQAIRNPGRCNLAVVRRKGFFDRRKGNRLSFAGWPDDFFA